jgi:leucyl/phenylalanyl-tRNA--protein transferase
MADILTPELILLAYGHGYFPMAHEEEDGEIYWHSPDPRTIIPLDGVIVSRSLRQTIRKGTYTIRFNTACEQVIRNCADRRETWISEEIIEVYTALHDLGYVHSVEAWYEDTLAGGLYGVAIGGAFFGESMFSVMDNASKTAFVALTEQLKKQDFLLLDSQYINPHMESLGAVEIPRKKYMRLLAEAIALDRSFL